MFMLHKIGQQGPFLRQTMLISEEKQKKHGGVIRRPALRTVECGRGVRRPAFHGFPPQGWFQTMFQ